MLEQPQLSHPIFVEEMFQPSDSFHSPPLEHYLVLGPPELDAVLHVASHKNLILPIMLLLMQPREGLAFDVARAHCWLMFNFSSTYVPKYFSVWLLSICPSTNLY